jgi:nicotinate-nucleotide adenylyltransferase
MERLGVFGGTFDPPHLGHLVLAETAREQLGLDCVLWVVAGQSPFKVHDAPSPAADRLALVEAAVASHPAFAASRVDLDRPGPHYSVDTVDLIARQNPGAALHFILGEDSLRDLPRWRAPGELIARCRLAAFQRPGIETDTAALEALIPGLQSRLDWIHAPQIEIAASDLRRRAREGRSLRYLVPDEVRELIERLDLYQTPLPNPQSPASNL